MATRITKEWRVQIGADRNGNKEYRAIGYELEDDFGGGNKTTRLKLCLDVLSPTMFALVRPFVKGSGHVIASRHDFAKRYKEAVQAEEPSEEGNDNGPAEEGEGE